jgi:hypothetical protein
MSPIRRAALTLGLLALPAVPSFAQEPLSAIDWLSRSVVTPAPSASLRAPQNDVANNLGAAIEVVAVQPLEGLNPQAVGLISPQRAGLPRGLWGATPEADLALLLRRERVETLPSMQRLLKLLMLAELDAPLQRSTGSDTLLLARVDRLLDMGALEPAFALLQLAGAGKPEHFQRLFDIALLLGEEDRACRMMQATPAITPSFSARIFCLARNGDWAAATTTLIGARALGAIEPAMAQLLAQFLDPELAEQEGDLPPPERPSPLVFRMMDAIGQPLPTGSLPLAFAQADLRGNPGWKTRIEAAERLARMGSVDANQLLGIYTERNAAAAGGVWDRVQAMAKLDAAVTARDTKAVMLALPVAHQHMVAAGLESHLAALFAKPLASLPLEGAAASLSLRLGLLSDDYEAIARGHTPQTPFDLFLLGIAQGSTLGLSAPNSLAAAIKQAFDAPPNLSDDFVHLMQSNRAGEALLRGIDMIAEGTEGDERLVSKGLGLLRHLGLEDSARRAALELMLMGRRT